VYVKAKEGGLVGAKLGEGSACIPGERFLGFMNWWCGFVDERVGSASAKMVFDDGGVNMLLASDDFGGCNCVWVGVNVECVVLVVEDGKFLVPWWWRKASERMEWMCWVVCLVSECGCVEFEMCVEREDFAFAVKVLCVSVHRAASGYAKGGVLNGLEFCHVSW